MDLKLTRREAHMLSELLGFVKIQDVPELGRIVNKLGDAGYRYKGNLLEPQIEFIGITSKD